MGIFGLGCAWERLRVNLGNKLVGIGCLLSAQPHFAILRKNEGEMMNGFEGGACESE